MEKIREENRQEAIEKEKQDGQDGEENSKEQAENKENPQKDGDVQMAADGTAADKMQTFGENKKLTD